MRIKPDCYPCFMHQVLNTSRLLGIPEEGQRALLAEAARTIAGVPPETPPPVVGGLVHAMVRRAAGSPDPFLDAKRADNRAMLARYPEMREAVRLSADPLETALAFAAGGNAMDHGIAGAVDAAAGDFRCEPAVYAAFRERL